MSTGALNTPGLITTGQFSPPTINGVGGSIPGGIPGTSTQFTFTDALNIFAFRPDLNLAATIRALQSQGLLQILAEPNLVTTNGKEANFLVGGEFPIPILQGGASAGSVSIVFREYGIRLNFNPSMTGNQTLKMYVKPEVSTLDLANSVTFAGFRIPALSTRRMETNIELAAGQSFVIGGLVDDRLEYTMTKIPGLSAIPVLGALFKSRLENKGKTELIVMVTPEIVDPLNPADPKPIPAMPREFIEPSADNYKNNKKTAVNAKNSRKSRKKVDKSDPVAATTPPVEGDSETAVTSEKNETPDTTATSQTVTTPETATPAEAAEASESTATQEVSANFEVSDGQTATKSENEQGQTSQTVTEPSPAPANENTAEGETTRDSPDAAATAASTPGSGGSQKE
jgi:hypothetical protein